MAAVAAFVIALGIVQLASESLNAYAAAPRTLPKRIPPAFGESVYRVLDRIAPAPYVESSLAETALARGDLPSAQRYALRLPASSKRDELLARIARASGRQELSLEYSLAAFDSDSVLAAAQKLAGDDPRAAYDLERLMAVRLSQGATHPDALAQTRWQMGLFANRTAWRQVPGSTTQRAWLRRALSNFEAAVALAPLSERYTIADANQADLLGERDRAAQLFRRAAAIDPGSADAIAGLGVVAFENGDRRTAAAYFEQARKLDSRSLMVRALERDLR